MAIDPTTTTTVKVSELASAGYNTTDLIPHEVAGILKKGNLQDLATFIGGIISTEGAVGFRAVTVTDGQTLPDTTEEEFILVGPGTYPNVGGGSAITTTEPLNALVSNGTYWFIGVEIPIGATGVWGTISGTLDDQTDLKDVLDLKADLVDGKVPASQLPSYVDDVVEVANYAALPSTGETGKIYITIDTNKVYRWSGSAYIEIAADKATWGLIEGTLSNQTDVQNALNAKFNNPTGNTTQYIAGDGSLITFPTAGQAGTLVREVRNTTGATLTKGTIVYISGATGNKPTVSKAIATGDSTSAQTFGMVQADISNNANGYVVCVGDITGLNTSAIAEGAQLYLSSTTAGAYTTTKQLAPNHLVYIGVVTRSHATLGQIEVKIQNGYELDEIHDVAISSKTNKDFLVYESSTDLWKNKSLGTIVGGTSSQFLKGNGVLDSTVYAIDSFVVHLTGDETITGKKTFNNSSSSISIDINNSSTGKGLNSLNSSSGFGIYSNNSSTGNGIHSVNSSTGKGIFSSNTSSSVGIYSDNSSTGAGLFSVNSSTGNGIHATNSSTGKGIYALNSSTGFGMYAENQSTGKGIYSLNSSTGYGIHSENASTGRGIYSDNKLGGFGIFSLNSSTGTGIYSNNTSSGKGIHSINSANGAGIYTENTSGGNGIYLNNTAAGTGVLIDNTGSVGLRVNNLSTTNGIYLDNSSTGNGVYSANSSTGNGFRSVNSSTGKGISSSNQSGGSGIYSFNSGSGSGIYAENSSSFGKAFYLNNTGIVGFEVYHNSGGTGILLENNGFKGLVVNNYLSGKAVIINNTTVGSGTPFSVQKNEVDKFTISDAGAVYAAGNVGIGTTSPGTQLHLNGSADLRMSNSANTTGFDIGLLGGNSDANAYIYQRANSNIIFGSNNTERMRITSGGNVGIGTTAPNQLLHIEKDQNTYTNLRVRNNDAGSSAYTMIGLNSSGNSWGMRMGSSAANSNRLDFVIDAFGSPVERMSITSGGNVGIGTTSPSTTLDVNGTGRINGGVNLATSSGNVGIGAGPASQKLDVNGNIRINNGNPTANTLIGILGFGPSGYGGINTSEISANFEGANWYNGSNLIFKTSQSGDITASSSVERMRITSGGNVGIGTTSPSAKLEVHSLIRATNTSSAAFQNAGLELFTYNGSSVSMGTALFSTNNNFNYGTIVSNQTNLYGIRSGGIRIATTEAPIIFSNGNADVDFAFERMRITSGGNNQYTGDPFIYSNTTSGGTAIHAGLRFNSTDKYIRFFTNDLGRMDITSGGDVCIGTTSATAGGVTVKTHISGGDFGLGISVDGSGSQQNIRFVNGTTAVGSVTTTSSITTYNTISDYRLKQDLKNIKGLDLISKIKVYDYEWKIDNSRSYGVLAHELQEVVPYAVRGEKDAEEMQQVDYSKLVPILVQAIQELKQEIEILKNK